MRSLILGIAFTVGLGTASAAAQEWQVERNAISGLTAAVATWSSGHAVVVRCQGRDFQVFLRFPDSIAGGTPSYISFEGQDRTVRLGLPIGQREGQVLFSQEPARAARWLAGSGSLRIEAPNQEPVDLVLPEDGAPIRAALTDCGRSLEDRRDTLLRAGRTIGWARRPEPGWPRQATQGPAVVSLSCIVGERGRLEDCVVERESPAGQGFGDEALRASRNARLNPDPANLALGTLIPFDIHFRLE